MLAEDLLQPVRARWAFDPSRTPAALALVAAFTLLWGFYFTMAEVPLGLKHDMTEAYAWGQAFQLGYNQHPPFWSWLCGLWFLVFPHTGWAFSLLSSLNAAIGLWGAWMLIGDFAEGRKRQAAWWLLLLTPLYTFYAFKYNANIIFLSVWPWTCHVFMRALRSRRTGDAVALGVMVGIALLSKYYAAILLVTCLAVALQLPSRRYFASWSPYLSAAVAALACAPHIAWLLANRAPPLRYLSAVSELDWRTVADYNSATLAGGLMMNAGVVAVCALAAWNRPRPAQARRAEPPPIGVLATFALLPLALTVILGVALRTRTTQEMALGTFALLPLLVIELFGARDIGRLHRIASRLAIGLFAGAVVLSPAIGLARVYAAQKLAPYEEVAIEATKIWRDRTGVKLAYVAASDWYENAIAFYSPDRPSSFFHFDYAKTLWIAPELIARRGLLIVCESSDRLCLDKMAPFLTPETSRTEVSLSRTVWGHVARPVTFVVEVVPPRP